MNSVKMLVTYRPKRGSEATLLALVGTHWPALHKAGLSTADAVTIYRAMDKRSGAVSFIEIFSWRDEHASTEAHHDAQIIAVWEPVMPILKSMDLAVVEPAESDPHIVFHDFG